MTGKDGKPKNKHNKEIFRKGQKDILQKLVNLIIKENNFHDQIVDGQKRLFNVK